MISSLHEVSFIQIGQRETEETGYLILVKFSSIQKLGIGYDEFGQPCESPRNSTLRAAENKPITVIIFDLYTPPTFEQESHNNNVPEGVEHKGRYKTRHRICTIDHAHANIAEYAHHLRIVLLEQDDLLHFEKICHIMQCEPRPLRVPRVNAQAMRFFSPRELSHVQRWTKTMTDWKNAFQIEAYLRNGLLNTHDLLVTLQKPIDDAIEHYKDKSSEFLRLFFGFLKNRKPEEHPRDCLERFSRDNPPQTIKLPRPTPGNISCHHVIITPSKMLLEGPYPTQSNRVIRRFQDHDSALVERFVRVEFRDEDRLTYRWDGDVDGTWFLKERVGGALRNGFEIGGRSFELLAYSNSALRDHSVWFVSPFRDPKEGFVTAEYIRSSLGDFSELLRMPSKYAARIAQNFGATERSVKIRPDEWEEQPDLIPEKTNEEDEVKEFTDGVGTISPELADKIWDARCKAEKEAGRNRSEKCVKPSAYQFRFLGYKGVVVVDNRLKGIKMRLRPSQRKFNVNHVEEEDFDIVKSFEKPNKVYLNRFVAVSSLRQYLRCSPDLR